MCGIAGWVSTVPGHFADADRTLTRMRDRLTHRGPDDAGNFLDRPHDIAAQGGAALGFRRLSIIDLSGGHQPMTNEDGTLWIVFNGEIYNHLELREQLLAAGHVFANHSDTEVLLHGWEEWQEALLPRLNGMFDLAIWDQKHRELLLARDRHGKKPLFCGVLDGGRTLIFGSELSAVAAHPAVQPEVDVHGLASLFTFDYVVSPRSLLRNVHTLEPGQFWRWRVPTHGAPTLQVDTYVGPTQPDERLAQLTQSEALRELDVRLRAAVERRLMADVPLGIFLSGGIDSSLVAAYAARLRSPGDLDTFSIGFADKRFDESSHARTVANYLGTRHHERILTPETALAALPDLLSRMDQPLADPSILPTWFLAHFAREHVTVALGGDGGDEWFLGYPTFFAHDVGRLCDIIGLSKASHVLQAVAARLPTSHGYMSLDFQIKRFVSGLGQKDGMRHVTWIGGVPTQNLPQLLSVDALRTLDRPRDAATPGHHDPQLTQQVRDVWQAWRRAGRDDMDALAGLYARFYLGDGVLQKVDRASMLNSLEVRAPLLDPAVVALAHALPTRMKLRGRQTKVILRQLAERQLPAEIVRRPKRGFAVPIGQWLRGPLKGFLTDALAPARVAELPYLNAPGVQQLVQEHLDGRADHRKPLWALLCLTSWTDRLAGAHRD
jgi:asparagine synthase (glutamine-hydrolysing)